MSEPVQTKLLDEIELLQQCPICDYSLRGLPVEHRCPECGVEFNRQWEILEASNIQSSRWPLLRFFNLGLLFLFLIPYVAWLAPFRRWIFPLVFLISFVASFAKANHGRGFLGLEANALVV